MVSYHMQEYVCACVCVLCSVVLCYQCLYMSEKQIKILETKKKKIYCGITTCYSSKWYAYPYNLAVSTLCAHIM